MSTESYVKNRPVVEMMNRKYEQALLSVTGLTYTVAAMPSEKKVTDEVDGLIAKCCAIWNVEYSFLVNRSRSYDRPIMRQIVSLIAKTRFPKVALRTIGEKIGGLDHTTVLHSIDKAKEHLDTCDAKFMNYYNRVSFLISEL